MKDQKREENIQRKRKKKRSAEDWIVDGFSYGIVAILVISIILPFMPGNYDLHEPSFCSE